MPYPFITYICQDHKHPLVCEIKNEKIICPQCGECEIDKDKEKNLLAYSYSTLGVHKKNFRFM